MFKNYYLLIIIIFYSLSYGVEVTDVNIEEETFLNDKFKFVQEIYDKSWALIIGINEYTNS